MPQGDLSLVVAEDKVIYPMCEYLRMLATRRGISAVEIEDYKLSPLTRQAVVS